MLKLFKDTLHYLKNRQIGLSSKAYSLRHVAPRPPRPTARELQGNSTAASFHCCHITATRVYTDVYRTEETVAEVKSNAGAETHGKLCGCLLHVA